MKTDSLGFYLKDIRFWILFFFIIRLIGITNPPLEMGHSWRQALTNMVSRNLYEVDPSLLYPRVDMGGEGSGIIGAEFPAYNFVISLWFRIGGFNHWIGRLINLIVSSIGIFYFYKIVRRFYRDKVAFSSTIVLLVSGWFGFSRKIMPDTVSVSLVLIGLYYAIRFLDKWKNKDLLLFVGFAGLGGLVKMPSVSLLAVLAIPLFCRQYPLRQKAMLISAGLLVLLPMILWYFYWVPHLLKVYDYPLFFPRSLLRGLNELWINWFDTLDKFFFASFFSFIAFSFFLAGMYFVFRYKQNLLQLSILLVSVIFFFYMMKTGDVFSFHSYYIIPYTPLMALIAGYGLSQLTPKWLYVVLVLISIEAIANQYDDFFIKESAKCKLDYEQIADAVSDKTDLVVVTGGLNPMTMYFLHRKGWSVGSDVITNKEKIMEMRDKGAKYIFVDRKQFDEPLDFPLILQTNCLAIYNLYEK